MRILLADDSVTAQNMGKKILAEAGHEVICVGNGAAALKKIAEQEPELVILDIYMPGYSGLEVCQRLKEGNATAHLPVVLTVGKLEPFRKEEAQRVHAEALIVKPFEASELAGAVARFAEITAGKSSKSKSKGKLAPPQAKPKPQWEEAPEDEFVNTTQKLQEQLEEKESASASKNEFSAPSWNAEEPEPAPAVAEFEATNAPEPCAAPTVDSPPETGAAAVVETAQPEGAAEFSVMPHQESSPAAEVAEKAAAAAAGAESGNFASVPGSTDSFAVNPPVEPAAQETAPFAVSTSDAPEMVSPRGPELSAATDPMAVPAVDPAFDPDRTQWASHYATRFGIAEEPAEEAEPAATPAEPVAEQPQGEAPSAAPSDEISAILSRLPGGMPASEPSPAAEPAVEFEQRPWPVESSGDTTAWNAEEVPIEDRDSSISLAEEMENAFRTADSGLRVQFAEPEQEPVAYEPVPVHEEAAHNVATETPVNSFQQETLHAPAPAAGESASESAPPAPEQSLDTPAANSVPEIKPAQPEPDRLASVMQSAAMAIATRATVSAVTSQLHTPPPESATAATGPSAIEELVSQVLERLKPKLIAEVKRELGTSEEK